MHWHIVYLEDATASDVDGTLTIGTYIYTKYRERSFKNIHTTTERKSLQLV